MYGIAEQASVGRELAPEAMPPLVGEGALAVPRALPLRVDGERLEHLSPSSIARFMRCPEDWRRHYILGERAPGSAKMLIGGAGATTAEYVLRGRLEGNEPSLDDAVEFAGVALGEKVAEEGAVLDEADISLETATEQTRDAVRAYLEGPAKRIRPVAVERALEYLLPGADWTVLGFMDVEEEDGTIRDLKVVTSHILPARAARDVQPTSYLAGRRAEGNPASRFVFDSVRRTKPRSGERCIEVEATRTQAQIERFAALVARIARLIWHYEVSGDWPYAPASGAWWCSSTACSHYRVCPGGGGA